MNKLQKQFEKETNRPAVFYGIKEQRYNKLYTAWLEKELDKRRTDA